MNCHVARRKDRMIGYILRHSGIAQLIIEGTTKGKGELERDWVKHIENIYKKVKDIVLDWQNNPRIVNWLQNNVFTHGKSVTKISICDLTLDTCTDWSEWSNVPINFSSLLSSDNNKTSLDIQYLSMGSG